MHPTLAPSPSPARRRPDAAADLRPEIIAPLKPVRTPALGDRFSLSCQARSCFPGMSLVYWLANGSFVEDRYLDAAVSEGAVREEPDSKGTLLSRELLFSSFSVQDWRTSFVCMVKNPAGLSTAPVHWLPEPPAQGWEPQQETMEDGQPPSTHTPLTGKEAWTAHKDSSAHP
ncbi:interleukin-18-binding protein isoform X4 [Pelodiscus sinensis]|uniref:interleukin-18-binding protein isoform X4 n=1 Tax=Pelodiscus sinensis TaxID=13735 RepID=UPI003F6C7949